MQWSNELHEPPFVIRPFLESVISKEKDTLQVVNDLLYSITALWCDQTGFKREQGQ